MKNIHVKPSSRNWKTKLFALLLVCAVLAASVPQPAQAAPVCAATYVVQEGDTTPKIAQSYGLKWGEIARANDLKYPYNLKEGQELCIPRVENTSANDDKEESTNPKAKFAPIAFGKYFTINASNFSVKSKYVVKVRDAATGVGGWYKVGNIRVNPNRDVKITFLLPKELRSNLYLSICLKDATTDELICRSVIHY